jgi:hypothetical protein
MDEIQLIRVDNQERRLAIAEEVVIIGLVQAFYVLGQKCALIIPPPTPNPLQKNSGAGLEEDDEVRNRGSCAKEQVDLFVETELIFIQVEVGEDPILGEEIIAEGELTEEVVLGKAELLTVAVEEEEELGLKGVTTDIPVEMFQEGVFLGCF